MDRLVKEATKSTPKIDFQPAIDKLVIEGEAYPENPFDFFDPLFSWLEDYLAEVGEQEIQVELRISYLNTSSTKSMMLFLNILEEAYQAGTEVKISWYYDPRNDLSYDIGKDFADYLELPFNLISQD